MLSYDSEIRKNPVASDMIHASDNFTEDLPITSLYEGTVRLDSNRVDWFSDLVDRQLNGRSFFLLLFAGFRVQLQRGTNKLRDGEEGKGASLEGNNQVC